MRVVSFFKSFWLEAGVLLLAFGLRVWDVFQVKSLMMDETYYVVEASSVLKRGYESYKVEEIANLVKDSVSAEGLNSLAGGVDKVYDFLSWHPPLGKWLIASGMFLFGSDNPAGWRVMSVLFGTGVVLLSMVLAFLIFRSKFVTVFTGLFMSVDGMAVAFSRVAMLDVFLTFFSLAGFVFLVKFIQTRVAASSKVWVWVVLTGVSFGLATAVKWSGLYFMAAAVLIAVVFEIFINKTGTTFWGKIKKVLFEGAIFAPSFVLTYLFTWSSYFFSYALPKNSGNVFEAVKLVVMQHVVMFKDAGAIVGDHNFKSKAVEWVFASHPTLMYSFKNISEGSSFFLASMPNLILWILSVVVFVFIIAGLVLRKVNPYTWVLVAAVVAAWLPWMLMVNRTTYQYYTVVFEPYLYVMLAFAVSKIWGYSKNNLGKIIVVFFTIIMLGFSALAYPGAAALPVKGKNMSYQIFNNWTNLNVELGLYDMSQVKDKELLK